jgi:hypothetical protein
MKKEVAITVRPKQKQDVDAWVENRSDEPESKPRVKPKRLTLDLDPAFHSRLKIHTAKIDVRISDLIRKLIEVELERHGA